MPGKRRIWRHILISCDARVLLTVLTVLTVRSRFNDPDLWWHLKTGELIWNTHSIPRDDPFSFTANGSPWIAQEWLSEVTIYGAWKFGGYSGLMLWLCALPSLVVVGAYTLCSVYSSNAKVAFLGGLVTWLFSTVGLAIRPHILGYLFLVFELLILQFGRSRDTRWFLALPPLFAIWINCHSSFFLGLVVLATVLLCSSFDFRLGLLICRRQEKHKRIMLAVGFALSLAALFINPIGTRLLVYPLDVMLNQPLNLQSVSEWQQPNFATGRSLALLGVAGLILLVPLLRRVELRLQELVLLVLALSLAIRHERMLFVFGILVAPILCRLLATAWDQYQPERDRIWLNAVLIGVSVAAVLLAFPSSRNLERQVQDGNPVKALEFIKRSGLSGPMLNEYIYGGYLIWAAPEHKVFIDGRADVYEPAGLLAEYGKWNMLEADPKTVLDKYHIAFCLLARENRMTRVLPLLPGWKSVYSDEQSVVLARSGAQKTPPVAELSQN